MISSFNASAARLATPAPVKPPSSVCGYDNVYRETLRPRIRRIIPTTSTATTMSTIHQITRYPQAGY
jgi:hypothetical protein